ncbi:DEAD/DEAH box helicase [Alcaligenes faecalis]|uniref:DEAD/DEAH box helicase n=1 Tax=Alcaligenes faecalis TaxID=511 RepID=UPI00203E97D6|nr:DEAD/DEAH box helicase [Alcaligenes faecalis]MCM2560507.1 DEAD/DEAH box helicase [Alcaligenes faecalis]MCM2621503.1 DEAD/DEAH box helicase [Alcaligenes faecalis]
MSIIPISLKAPDLLIQAVFDGRRLGLQLFNISGMATRLSKAGAWWCPGRRMWVLEQGSVDHALAWLEALYLREHVDFGGAAALLKAAIRAPEPDYFTQLLDVQIFELARGELNHGQHAVSFSYDALCVRAMRALQGRFHKPAAAWQVRGDVVHIQQVLRDLAGVAPEYTFVHEQPVVLEELVSANADESPIQVPAATPEQGESGPAQDVDGAGFLSADLEQSNAVDIDEAVLAAIAVGAGLRDYQVDGVRHLAGQTGACLGDDMGLGKTRQTVVGARLAAGQGRVLIVCPASLRINWEREIHAVYPDAVVGFAGDDRISTLYGCQWVIANYERLGGLVREVGLAFGAMAIDEAHYLKEHKSGRTRNAFVMATRIPKRYVVTGTPLLNREIELHTLLRLTGHSLGRMELKEFRKEFTGSRDRRAALARALGGWMLRRRKDVLDLGAKTHSVRYISPSEGLAAYKEIYDDMSMMAMPKITKLRQCLETLKTPFLIETVEGLQAEDKIIIFCEYMSTVNAMHDAFMAAGIKAVRLVGADSATKRQKAIDMFQDDPEIRVFIGTTMAAGVGITLTAANYVAFASMPWTPALMRQAEDRAYRMGQQRDVMVIVPLIPDTIDEAVWKILEGKRETEIDVVEAVTMMQASEAATITNVSLERWINSEPVSLERA